MSDNVAPTHRPRVLSGMRPTGKLHLGNYMGALANWVNLQDAYECYFFIADYHALTTDYADPSRIKLNTVDVALDWLAAGLDPERSTIFIQSHVPQHAELHLLFSMITPLGWLERVPTYKEQQENLSSKDLTTYGFLGYPLLQSADILLYQPQYVPVGQDQVAHVELTREVARRFNSLYKSTVFPEPEVLLTPSPKLTGTDGRKMSKSYGNTIGLTESPKAVEAKVLSMSTNGQRAIQSDPGNPDLCPVADLHKAFSLPVIADEWLTNCRAARGSCSECRRAAATSVQQHITPFFERRQQYEANIPAVWEMLREQSRKAEARAEQTMLEARKILDLSRILTAEEATTFQIRMKAQEFKPEGMSFIVLESLSEHDDYASKISIRNAWQQLLPTDIVLTQPAVTGFTPERAYEEPFIQPARKKRVFATAALEKQTFDQSGILGQISDFHTWSFSIPTKSYDVWALLCASRNDSWLNDFIVPPKYFVESFAKAKKASKTGYVPAVVRSQQNSYTLTVGDAAPVDITTLLSNYTPLK